MPTKKIPTSEHWTEKVYAIVRQIPKGKVTSYGAIADAVGTRTTSRMVGWAMNASHNVKPPIPAHRVVNRNGILTGKHHFANPMLMQHLLEAEGIPIDDDKIINFKNYYWLPTFSK